MSEADSASDKTMLGATLTQAGTQAEIGHYLTYMQEGTPMRVQIAAGGVTIGRVAPSDVVISHPQISRQHCRIELTRGWAMITDLGSTNGSFVDGKKVEQRQRLVPGCRINLGAFALRYERREQQEVAREAEHVADLQRAEAYVRAILPAPLPQGPVQADWCFTPSATLGGDAFGYKFHNEQIFTGFLLDVSGHGIGSAMHAANVANTLRRYGLPEVDFADPAQVAAGLNRMFPMEEHNGLMLTIWYFAYHLPTRRLRFCAAGHHPALLASPQAPEPAPLWLRGPAIGFLPLGKWSFGEMVLPPAAALTIFSDGAFEIMDSSGRQWEMEDFRQLVARGLSPQALYQAVRAAARPGPLDDDFSVLQLRFA